MSEETQWLCFNMLKIQSVQMLYECVRHVPRTHLYEEKKKKKKSTSQTRFRCDFFLFRDRVRFFNFFLFYFVSI